MYLNVYKYNVKSQSFTVVKNYTNNGLLNSIKNSSTASNSIV